MTVIGFIDGVTFDDASFKIPGNIARAAAAVRQLHSGPRFVNDFNMFVIQQQYLYMVQRNGFRLPPGYLDFAPHVARIKGALAVQRRRHGALQQRPAGSQLHRRRRTRSG